MLSGEQESSPPGFLLPCVPFERSFYLITSPFESGVGSRFCTSRAQPSVLPRGRFPTPWPPRPSCGILLGLWLNGLGGYRKVGRSALTEDQIRCLDEPGMVWRKKTANTGGYKMPQKIKILVACHRQYPVPDEPCCLPVEAGASLHTKPIPGFTPDNTGDSISEKNKNYCERTALCWAWKKPGRGLHRPCSLQTAFQQREAFQEKRSPGHLRGEAFGSAERLRYSSPQAPCLLDRDKLQPVCSRPSCDRPGYRAGDLAGAIPGIRKSLRRLHEAQRRPPLQHVRHEPQKPQRLLHLAL